MTNRKHERVIQHGREAELLAFIKGFVKVYKYPPSYTEMRTGINAKCNNPIRTSLERLEKAGWIKRDRNISRGITLK